MEFEYKRWPSQLPFDFIQTISVVFQKTWRLKSSVWYSSFSQVLAFFSSLEFMSFAPTPLILLELLGQWSLAAALVLASAKSVMYPTGETASSRKQTTFGLFLFLSECFFVLFLFFLGKSEVYLFLPVDWIQTVVSLTEQILIIENTKISHFVSCGWTSAFPLGLYLFTVSDNF